MNRQWILRARPAQAIEPDTFAWREVPLPDVGAGEFLVRNLWLSFDPAQRGWMNDRDSYVPPVPLGAPMRARAVAQVAKSRNPDFAEGDLVLGSFGWQDYALSNGQGDLAVRKIPAEMPPNHALSVFGTTGLTAYIGMTQIARPQPGDTVVVSAAAGSTGSIAGQIAKIMGAGQVIGIAGGREKCAWLTQEAHFDHAIDHRSEDVGRRLSALAPNGMDVYFDNVGGSILEECLAHIAQRARVVLCGNISSGYGTTSTPGPRNYFQLAIRSARMEGFIGISYQDRLQEAIDAIGRWIGEGRICHREDVVLGLEQAPATLMRLFRGQNIGKQLLKIADPVAA